MIALQAVTPAQGSVAASASVRWSGTGTTPRAGKTRWVASTPSSGPPSRPASRSAGGGPPSQFWKKAGATRSPGLRSVTSLAGLDDDADPVGQRDQRRLHPPPVLAAQDDEVAVVERGGAHFEQHVARAGARGLGLAQDEVVVAEAVSKDQ
jgi:hypothetical protein